MKYNCKGLACVLSMLKIGCIGFGGGSALIPVIEQEVVEKRHISKEEYDKVVVVASITPGALPVEIATGVGRKYGILGMLLSSHAIALPGAFLTILLLTILSGLSTSVLTLITALSIVITPVILSFLMSYITDVLVDGKRESMLRMGKVICISLGVFLLAGGKQLFRLFHISGTPFFSLSTVAVLGIACFGIVWLHADYALKNLILPGAIIVSYLLCQRYHWTVGSVAVETILVIVMAVMTLVRGYQSFTRGAQVKKKISWMPLGREIIVWIFGALLFSIPAVLLVGDSLWYLLKGLLSSVLSFGGGDAYLTVADGMFVESGMILREEYYGHLVGIVNVLPGSILCKTLTGVGYYVGLNGTGSIFAGLLVALAGFVVSVAASGSVYSLVNFLYERFEKIDIFQLLRRWIRPIVSGLLLNVMLALLNQNIASGAKLGISTIPVLGITFAWFAVVSFFRCWRKRGRNT